MAKIKYGPIIGSASGSIGGMTLSHNRYGTYMRRRAIPVVSTTSFALAAKARFSAGSQAYQSLTAAQRLAWKTWAQTNKVTDSLGDPQELSAHAAYVGLWARADLYGTAPISDPPVAEGPVSLESLSLTGDIGLGDVSAIFTETPLGASDHLWIYACVVDSAGINYVQNLLRFVGESAGAQASPYIFEALVTARFGVLQIGQTLHVQVSVFNDATYQISQPLGASVVITST